MKTIICASILSRAVDDKIEIAWSKGVAVCTGGISWHNIDDLRINARVGQPE